MSFLDKHGLETLVGEIKNYALEKLPIEYNKQIDVSKNDSNNSLHITAQIADTNELAMLYVDLTIFSSIDKSTKSTSLSVCYDNSEITSAKFTDDNIEMTATDKKENIKYKLEKNTENKYIIHILVKATQPSDIHYIVHSKGINIENIVYETINSRAHSPINYTEFNTSELQKALDNASSSGGGGGSSSYADKAGKLSNVAQANTGGFRNVWFNDSQTAGLPVVDSDFQYNPSTNALKVGALKFVGTDQSLKIRTATGNTSIEGGKTKYIGLASKLGVGIFESGIGAVPIFATITELSTNSGSSSWENIDKVFINAALAPITTPNGSLIGFEPQVILQNKTDSELTIYWNVLCIYDSSIEKE